MPLNRRNTRFFHRRLYAGELQTLTLLKRGNDQQQGTVTKYTIFECRRGDISKQNEPISLDETADHTAQWLIPSSELKRVGVLYLNADDRIIDRFNRYWQIESDTPVEIKTFENYTVVTMKRNDPPGNVVLPSEGW